jgi:hypothetical protein
MGSGISVTVTDTIPRPPPISSRRAELPRSLAETRDRRGVRRGPTDQRKAAAKLKRLGQIDVGISRLRELVERADRQVLDVRRRGLLSPSWTGELLHLAKHEGPLAVLKEIAATREMAALACVEQSNTLNGYWSLQRQGVA